MINKIYGGKNTYGQIIGIIMLERNFPRIPGDIGNASTFNFPVKYHLLKELNYSTRKRLFNGDKEFIDIFIEAAKTLEAEGVRAITSSCGFIVSYQDIVSNSVSIPVFTSSLMQIPLIYKMLRKEQKIGIITADGSSGGLRTKHLQACSAEDIPIIIKGMENSVGFKAIRENRDNLDVNLLEKDSVNAAIEMTKSNLNIGAIVVECTNLSPYSKAIQEAVNLPVFDIVTLTNWVYSSLIKNECNG